MGNYYIVLFVIIGLGLLPIPKKIKIAILIVVLTVFAGTRIDIDNDFSLYQSVFQSVTESLADFQATFNLEIQMYLIPKFFGLFTPDNLLIANICFVFFALLGVSLKISAISKISPYFFLSLLLYFTNLYFVQEMTSIRAGIASGIFLWVIYLFVNKKYIPAAVLIAFSYTFHNSSVLFVLALLPIFFKLKIRYYYYLLVLSFVLAMVGFNLVEVLRLDLIFSKVGTYLEMMSWQNETLNIYNFRILISLLFVVLFGYQYKKFADNTLIDTLFKIHIISLALFYALSLSSPTFSLRVFELLSVVQILLFPYYISILDQKLRFVGIVVLVFVIVLQFFYFAEFSNLLRPYQSWYL